MVPIGRVLIIIGVILIILGIIFTYTNIFSSLKLGRLPGDISYKRGHFSLYFPLTTCIVVSIIFTLILYFFRK